MTEPTITYDEMKEALEKDSCTRINEPALFALLDKLNPANKSLVGRLATDKFGHRVMVISDQADEDGMVAVIVKGASLKTSTGQESAKFLTRLSELILDPATLKTADAFDDAPVGTIVEELEGEFNVYVNVDGIWYGINENNAWPSRAMSPARVIRWGNGR